MIEEVGRDYCDFIMKTKLEIDDEIEEFRGKSRMQIVSCYLWRRIKPIEQIIASLETGDLKKNNILFTHSKSKVIRVEEGLLRLGQLDTLQKLFHLYPVKPLGYCWKDEWLMQKLTLENQLFGKYPAIKEESCDKRFTIYVGLTGILFLKQPIDGTTKDYLAETPNKSMVKVSVEKVNAGAFTALNISSDSPQSSKTEMEIENTQSVLDAFGAKDEAQKAFKLSCQPSHLQSTLPNMNTQNKSPSNVSHLLLVIAAFLSAITFHMAVKIGGCRSEESYKYNALLNPIYQIVNQHPYIFGLVIAFNSIVFFLSIALMMILFSELPLRSLLLLSAFSMLGTYMCIILSH